MANNEQEAEKVAADKEEVAAQKWHGGLKLVINCPIDKAWSLSADFSNLHRWVPTTESCERVEGEHQKPGCVRFCSGGSFPRADGGKSWVREKLLTLDDENRTTSYIMMDNNLGLSEYMANFKMQDLGDGAVLVDWSYEMNPIPGSTEPKTADYITSVYTKVLRGLETLANSN